MVEIWEGIVGFLREHPLIPVFLTLGLGFRLGKVRMGSFALGSVAATLIVGVIIGQLKINVPDILKNVFFLFFLFAVGYNVGPQFFRSMKGQGLKMALFALVEAGVCAALVIGAARLMGYGSAIGAGLYAGSQTVSASLGLLGDTVKELPMDPAVREDMLALIPACYAVTYVFGTVGTAWFLSSVAPYLMGGMKKVKEETARLEQEMDRGKHSLQPGMIAASRPVMFRAYRVESDWFETPRSVKEIQDRYSGQGMRIMVERLFTNGEIVNPAPETMVGQGDNIVLGGRSENIIGLKDAPGPEINDSSLLNFGAERTPVTISGKTDGITIGKLVESPEMERVAIAGVTRNGRTIPCKPATELHGGDVIVLVGWPCDVERAASCIGYADRQTDSTDMVFVGIGIAIGCIIGALSIRIKGIPMSLGLSVGTLLSGLVLGWLRAKQPRFGHIPSSVVWLFNNLGINMFIAVLGITAGGALIKGINEAGIWIILVGAALTLIGIVINIFIARKIFRLPAPVALGCIAGGRCCVAAIGAVQDRLQSDVPNLGYTVTYAVGNVTLVFASLAVLFMV